MFFVYTIRNCYEVMMRPSTRSVLLLSACAAVVLGHAPPSQAHFLWLKAAQSKGQTQAVLFFGESAADEAYHLPERLADTAIWRRTPRSSRTKLA